jgi:pyruvate-formate lyase-activating enzyme
MSATRQAGPTILTTAQFDSDGVVCYRHGGAESAHLIYPIAQQAMLGGFFAARYMEGAISVPYAEYLDLDLLPPPQKDPVARAAADWLQSHAVPTRNDGVAWLHDFDFVYTAGDRPIPAPWLSGIAQANALLACLHWWRHTGDKRWSDLARRAVPAFLTDANRSDGVAIRLESGGTWFEEYPTTPRSQVLNCHLLSCLALHKAAVLVDSSAASKAFEEGCTALRTQLHRYDLADWSRYDQYNRLFLLLRAIPSKQGTIAVAGIRLKTTGGLLLAELDAATSEPCDDPVSRLGGIDWGPAQSYDGRNARLILNRQAQHAGNIPMGGTDQNTYLIFEDRSAPEPWIDSGLLLEIDVFTSNGGQLDFETRDLRSENLAFRALSKDVCCGKEGWQTIVIPVPASRIGRPLPRNYHRFQTELLGTLLAHREDASMQAVFRRWHAADFYDVPAIRAPTPAPQTIYAFVNDRCGLKCKMCDIGIENRGIDQEALLNVPGRFGEVDRSISVLRPSLSLNMTDRARDLDPEILIRTISRFEPSGKDVLLQVNGTEPLLYPEYPELLRAARGAGMKTGITTSGITLNREARRLAEAGLDQLFLSIDGPPAIHDEIRGVPKLFSRIVEGVAALDRACSELKAQRPEVVVSFAVTLDNHSSILEFLDAVRPLRPDAVILNHLNFVAPQVASRHNAAHPNYPIGPSSVPAWEDCLKMDFLELFRQIEIARRADWTDVRIIPFCPTPTRLQWYYTRPELPMSRPRCEAVQSCVQVRADGTVAALGRCFSVSMGDLKSEELGAVWHGPAYGELRGLVESNPFLEACMRCCGSL